MNGATVSRLTSGALAVGLTVAIGVGLHQSNRADGAAEAAATWKQEAMAWRDLADQTTARNAALTTRYNRLAERSNRLTTRLEAAQLAAIETGAETDLAAIATSTSATQPVATVAAPATPEPVVQAAPATAPSSQAS